MEHPDDLLDELFDPNNPLVEQATYKPGQYDEAPLNVIFTDEFAGIDTLSGQVDSSIPMLKVRSSSVPNIRRQDALIVNGIDYTVDDIEPDGSGVTILTLKKVY